MRPYDYLKNRKPKLATDQIAQPELTVWGAVLAGGRGYPPNNYPSGMLITQMHIPRGLFAAT